MVFSKKKQLQNGYIAILYFPCALYYDGKERMCLFFKKFKEFIHRIFNTSVI